MCDERQSLDTRVDDYIRRLSLIEKLGGLSNSANPMPSVGNTGGYEWWNEALHVWYTVPSSLAQLSHGLCIGGVGRVSNHQWYSGLSNVFPPSDHHCLLVEHIPFQSHRHGNWAGGPRLPQPASPRLQGLCHGAHSLGA